jgi:hypothetical protein
MDTEYKISLDTKLTPQRGLWLLAAFCFLIPLDLDSEDFAVTTYYPPTYVAYTKASVASFAEGGIGPLSSRIMIGNSAAMYSAYGSSYYSGTWPGGSAYGYGIHSSGDLNVYSGAGSVVFGSGGLIENPAATSYTNASPGIGRLCKWVPDVSFNLHTLDVTNHDPCNTSNPSENEYWISIGDGETDNSTAGVIKTYMEFMYGTPLGLAAGTDGAGGVMCCRIRMNCGTNNTYPGMPGNSNTTGVDPTGTCSNWYSTSGNYTYYSSPAP